MKVSICAENFELIAMPNDPQGDMIGRQKKFQQRVGSYDDNLKDYGPLTGETYCLPMKVLHHLDMASQEVSEAWDMVEGGWKHHKTKPTPCDPDELLMELVDVLHFVYNAYLFMGGSPEEQLVAASVGRSKQEFRLPVVGFDDVWAMGERSWKRNGGRINALYGHGSGAHGPEWEKEVATRLNYLHSKIAQTTMTIRGGLEKMNARQRQPENFPSASGYVYIEIMPWLMTCFQAIPGCTQEMVYSAFVWKNDINHARQNDGY